MSNYKWVCNECKTIFEPAENNMSFQCPKCGAKETSIIYVATPIRVNLRNSTKVR